MAWATFVAPDSGSPRIRCSHPPLSLRVIPRTFPDSVHDPFYGARPVVLLLVIVTVLVNREFVRKSTARVLAAGGWRLLA